MDEVNLALRRLPVYLLIDTSSAMAGEAMESVKTAVRVFLDGLLMDPQALETVWLSIITFDCEARQLVPLTAIDEFSIPTPFSPPSGLAAGSFNGLHTKSKFLAAIFANPVISPSEAAALLFNCLACAGRLNAPGQAPVSVSGEAKCNSAGQNAIQRDREIIASVGVLG